MIKTPDRKSAKKAAYQSYCPLKLGCEKIVFKKLVVGANHITFLSKVTPLIIQTLNDD